MSEEAKIIYKIYEYETSNRFYKLQKGVEYGNRFNIKSIITLQTKNGEEKIKSFIFKIDERNIFLKGNVKVPIKSIKGVEHETVAPTLRGNRWERFNNRFSSRCGSNGNGKD